MARYLTFEQRLLKYRRRKKVINFIIFFLVLNYLSSAFIFKIIFFKNDEMPSSISKNSTLFFVSRTLVSFFYPLKNNDIILYRNNSLNSSFFSKFLKEIFFLDKFLTNEYRVSRIISTPGDIVYVKGKDVLVNKKNSNIYYLNGIIKKDYLLREFFNTDDVIKIYKLKKNSYFILNDNLDILNDSRVYGPLKTKEIKFILILKDLGN